MSEAVILAGGGCGLWGPESPGTTGTPRLPGPARPSLVPLSPPQRAHSPLFQERNSCLGESLCLLVLSLPAHGSSPHALRTTASSGRALIHAQVPPDIHTVDWNRGPVLTYPTVSSSLPAFLSLSPLNPVLPPPPPARLTLCRLTSSYGQGFPGFPCSLCSLQCGHCGHHTPWLPPGAVISIGSG